MKFVLLLSLSFCIASWFQELQCSSISGEERSDKRKRSADSDEERPKKRAKLGSLAELGAGLDLNTPAGHIFTILSKIQPGKDLFIHQNEMAKHGSQLDLESLDFTLKMLGELAKANNADIADYYTFAGTRPQILRGPEISHVLPDLGR
ncbi:hypothetical protein PSACC_01731 [Paramicrosporidium saccamoebae]|uniref:Uncharacterized protein n=1 Tax=Paramicrosporidium saccamoebae TaxID=1246581 RepID=A0A2H9TL42_9FUNG|nr:hypothetical protein PSACC_01731 [Paramicrosporidium saccamoebae]